MSGILGVVDFEGAPVHPSSLQSLARRMERTALDGSIVRVAGNAGFARSTLLTRSGTRGPHLGDDSLWIAADARIDARADLIAKLDPEDRTFLAGAADEDLILAAYRRWGPHCADHLLGDFSFAIWDPTRARLLCARDRFGVRPFFYSWNGQRMVFGNVLDCVRGFPGVQAELDDDAIADFLLFEHNQCSTSTVYAGIRRLAAATCLEIRGQECRTRRYWALPIEPELAHRRAGEHIERFREVLGRAVADRLTMPRAAIMMSGGMDSTAIAAAALEPAAGSMPDLRAFTVVYDRLIPDSERHYSGIAAAQLGIPIEHLDLDAYRLFGRFGELKDYLQEPSADPLAAQSVDVARRAAGHARIALTGWDGDALLAESPRPYLRTLASRREWGRAAVLVSRYASRKPSAILRQWQRMRGQASMASPPPFPEWIQRALVDRLRLRERWDAFHSKARMTHALRPYAYHVLGYIADRSDFFDVYHPAWTGAPIEFSHPLLDARVVDFCLGLPPFPWCHEKQLLRDAMRGRLPAEILRRPKTPLAGFPYMRMLEKPESRWIDEFIACRALERYVDRSKLPCARAEPDSDLAWVLMRPLGLDLWLRATLAPQAHFQEKRHEFA